MAYPRPWVRERRYSCPRGHGTGTSRVPDRFSSGRDKEQRPRPADARGTGRNPPSTNRRQTLPPRLKPSHQRERFPAGYIADPQELKTGRKADRCNRLRKCFPVPKQSFGGIGHVNEDCGYWIHQDTQYFRGMSASPRKAKTRRLLVSTYYSGTRRLRRPRKFLECRAGIAQRKAPRSRCCEGLYSSGTDQAETLVFSSWRSA